MNSRHAEVSRSRHITRNKPRHITRNKPRLAEAVLVDVSNIPAPDR